MRTCCKVIFISRSPVLYVASTHPPSEPHVTLTHTMITYILIRKFPLSFRFQSLVTWRSQAPTSRQGRSPRLSTPNTTQTTSRVGSRSKGAHMRGSRSPSPTSTSPTTVGSQLSLSSKYHYTGCFVHSLLLTTVHTLTYWVQIQAHRGSVD